MNSKLLTEYPDAPDIESSTRDYAARFSGEVGEWLLSRQTDATRRAFDQFFPVGRDLRVLDVGGGHGQNVKLVSGMGHTITIVGSKDTCGELVQSEVDAARAAYTTAPLLELPFEDNSFDVVICYRILSHMTSWRRLVAELCRVSSDVVLVDYPARKSVNIVSTLLFNVKKRIEKNTRHYASFSDRDVDRAFLDSGLDQRFRFRQFMLPMALHRLVNNPAFSRKSSKVCRKVGLTDLFGSPVIAGYRKIN